MSNTSFPIQDDCSRCLWRKQRLFCSVSGTALRQLQQIALLNIYEAEKVLYTEGRPAEGVYILCNGRAKIYTTSESGKTIIFKIASPGEVLGLDAVLNDGVHRETVELLDTCQVKFISKSQLIGYLVADSQAALKAVAQLNANHRAAREQIRCIGLSMSGTEKVARLLMVWAHQSGGGRVGISFTIPYTHEEIAQMIGSTRETVTRVFTKFKQQKAIEICHSRCVVKDFRSLAHFAGEYEASQDEPSW